MKRTTKQSIAAGTLTGLVNGFFGAGGGIILVPLLRRLGLSTREALATSVSTVLPICLVSVAVYLLRGQLNLLQAWPFLIGGTLGGLLGGLWLRRVSVRLLEIAFALVMIYTGVRNLL